ncbi:MAG TPA: glycosyltransferase 87 family protein [Thermomicrobiaceae bacterium]|nr:glycosyltransferase 87 family protein [Thermomicrobiaceae bacterium]
MGVDRRGEGDAAAQRRGLAALALAGLGLILVAALDLAVADLPGHFRDPRLTLASLGSARAVTLGTLAALLIAFGCYVVAWLGVQRLRPTRGALALVLGVPTIAAALLTPSYPLLSRDFFYNVVSARTLGRYGQNPFRVPPGHFPADPFLPYADWHQLTMPYGPLWAQLTGALAWSSGDDLLATFLAFKLLALASFLGATAALLWLLAGLDRDRLLPGLVLWAWNPLVLVEAVGNAHNDILMLALLLAGLALTLRGRATTALITLALAVAVKQVALALLPLVLVYLARQQPTWRARLRALAPGLLAAAMLLAALYASLWAGFRQTALSFAGQTEFYRASPLALARMLLLHVTPTPEPALRLAVAILAAGGYLWLLWRLGRRPDDLLSTGYSAFLLLILLWPVFAPWYVPWLVALAAAGPARRCAWQAIVLSATAAASYLGQYGPRQLLVHSPGFWSAAAALLVFVPLVLMLVWQRAGLKPVPTGDSSSPLAPAGERGWG